MDLQYPIGQYTAPQKISAVHRESWIQVLEHAPAQYKHWVNQLSDAQLDTPYRPGGWTLRQVIHHVPDSHMNAYIRFKLALTEEQPTIKPYLEARWANLPDTALTPVAVSLDLLEAIHKRWVVLLRQMTEEEWKRTFIHPEILARVQEHPEEMISLRANKGSGLPPYLLRLENVLGNYAWHSQHHLAHIRIIADPQGILQEG